MPRSRSFTRLTMRVGLLHFGQSVDFVVSITFLRSPVFAIFAIGRVFLLQRGCLCTHAQWLARGFNGAVMCCPSLQWNCLEGAGLADSSLHQSTKADRRGERSDGLSLADPFPPRLPASSPVPAAANCRLGRSAHSPGQIATSPVWNCPAVHRAHYQDSLQAVSASASVPVS